MIACVCFGIGEALILFLCGLLGLCKLCAKKHLKCKDHHCHDDILDEEGNDTGFDWCTNCNGRGHLDDADLGAPATMCAVCKGKGVIEG